jgi:hypothetical protein
MRSRIAKEKARQLPGFFFGEADRAAGRSDRVDK